MIYALTLISKSGINMKDSVGQEIWCVEINMDEDPCNKCSWNIDTLKRIIELNFERAVSRQKSNNWIIIGIRDSNVEAHSLADKLILTIRDERTKMGLEKNKRNIYGLDELINEGEKLIQIDRGSFK